MTGNASHDEKERFAYWSGYAPAKRAVDGTVAPLDPDELRSEAARFRRGADRAAADGDAAMAEKLRMAAADFDHRADASGQAIGAQASLTSLEATDTVRRGRYELPRTKSQPTVSERTYRQRG